MIAKLVTGPLVEPVDLGSARLHLRVDDTTEDDAIAAMITAAREHVEHVTRRALLTQTWDVCLPGWPSGDAIVLPFGNLQTAGLSVTWKDDDGTETTLTLTTDYLIETNGAQCGRIVLPYGGAWPTGTLYPSNPITVRFACGWTTPVLVPYTIKAAMKLILADLYEMRGEPVLGQTVTEHKTASRLLASWRLWDEF